MICTKKIKHLPITIIDGDRSSRYPKRSEFREKGVLFLNTTNIVQNRLDITEANFVSPEKFNGIKKGRLQRFDIVMTARGSIGKVALFDCDPPEGLINAQMLILRADGEVIDQKFLFYQICSDNFQTKLKNFASGSAQPQIPIIDLKEIEIVVPDFPTQRKIATVLSAYDDLIENNTRRIKILEEMAQAIYREWFVEFRFPGHEGVEMVESELGMIPQGWEVKRLSDLVETQYGYTESATDDDVGPKFVRGKDINKNSYIDWNTVPFCPIEPEKYAKYRLHAGDILVIRMADPGKVTIIEKQIDAVFASYLIRLKLNSKRLLPYYLFCTLLDERYQNYVYGVSTGTTRKSASAGVITGFDLVIPTDEVRDRFEIVIDSLRKALNNLLEKNTALRQTRDLLLPKLISGEIDVSEIDINTNKNMEANNG